MFQTPNNCSRVAVADGWILVMLTREQWGFLGSAPHPAPKAMLLGMSGLRGFAPHCPGVVSLCWEQPFLSKSSGLPSLEGFQGCDFHIGITTKHLSGRSEFPEEPNRALLNFGSGNSILGLCSV